MALALFRLLPPLPLLRISPPDKTSVQQLWAKARLVGGGEASILRRGAQRHWLQPAAAHLLAASSSRVTCGA